jgi:hypothetical protein
VLLALLALLVWQLWPTQPSRRDRPKRRVAATEERRRTSEDPLHSPLFAPRGDEVPADDTIRSEIATDERYNLVCRLSAPVEMASVPFEDDRGAPGVAMFLGSELWMIVPPGDGSATIVPPGAGPVVVSWRSAGETSRGVCTPDPIEVAPMARATVRGFVSQGGRDLSATVTVEGCGAVAVVAPDGAYELSAFAGTCSLQAFRPDGLFRARSPVVDVDLAPNEEYRVDLELPAWRTGGLGLRIAVADDGIAIDRVIPGGSGAEAGLQPGDVIVSLDGDPLSELGVSEFQDRALGQAGTPVSLVVHGADGVEREVTLERRAMGTANEEDR